MVDGGAVDVLVVVHVLGNVELDPGVFIPEPIGIVLVFRIVGSDDLIAVFMEIVIGNGGSRAVFLPVIAHVRTHVGVGEGHLDNGILHVVPPQTLELEVAVGARRGGFLHDPGHVAGDLVHGLLIEAEDRAGGRIGHAGIGELPGTDKDLGAADLDEGAVLDLEFVSARVL